MPRVSMKKVDIILALLLMPLSGWVFYESGKWPRLPDLGNPAWIPWGVALCLLAAAFFLLIKALKDQSLTLPSRLEGADRTRVIEVALLTGAYVIFLEKIGFIAATTAYLFGFGLALGERRWVRLFLFSIAVPLATYLLFDRTLHVPLPRGWLV